MYVPGMVDKPLQNCIHQRLDDKNKYKRRYIVDRQTRTQPASKMFTSLLFCSCLVAFWSTGSVSTNSLVDPTAYANLLALLTGNTELASPARVPYLRRLPQHQGKNVIAYFL
jgi:hypothetical protein